MTLESTMYVTTLTMINHPTKPLLSAAAALMLLAIPTLSAQEDDTPQFEEEIEVAEVTLDVVVTDKQGNAVLGLGPEDFLVEENGEPVEVLSATSYSSRYVAESEKEPDSRFIIVVVHTPIGAEADRPGMLRERMQLGRELADWLDDGPQPADWIAVASYRSSLKILQDFTQDRELLRAAVEKAGMGKEPRSRRRNRESGSPFTLGAALPAGRQLMRESATFYDGLGLLGDAAGRILGRKMLVLFSPGFGEFGNNFNLARRHERYYDELVARLNANNVAVFPTDLTSPNVDHPQRDMLQRLASDTGGDFAPYVTRYARRMRDVSSFNSVYYLLAYRAERDRGDKGFRKVSVRTANPDFKVTARSGFMYDP